MRHSLNCTIPQSNITYQIEIESGLLDRPQKLIQDLNTSGSKIAIITDDQVKTLYGLKLQQLLSTNNLECLLLSFPHGEEHKTREIKQRLEEQLLEKEFGRDSCIIALGGGVVLDVAGFLAATFNRGIPLIMIPTTLLAMADACLGGKNGVNVSQGKNQIGTIYHPKQVLIDPLTLKTLPNNELKFGIVEMIKHGVIADPTHFEFLEAHSEKLLQLEPHILEKAIFDSCKIKMAIVQEDEKDFGKRNLLNFGHTVGHALELLSDYTMPHGQAVALGMIIESHLSLQLGHLEQSSFDRIFNILSLYDLPFEIPKNLSIESILSAMTSDKKSIKSKPRYVLINGIGSCLPCEGTYCAYVEDIMMVNAIEWMHCVVYPAFP